MPTLRVYGACYCGAIAFEADVDPERVTICHCHACQALTGSAYRVTAPADARSFRLLRGTPRVFVKTAESGNRRAMVFCGDCGSPVYAHDATGEPTSYGLRVGCLQERAQLVPRRRVWCESALAWTTDLSGMTAIDRQ